ncbi:MAG: hypothetical protein ACFFA0_02180 [Promethearchaeota archaeon]
MEHKKIIKFLLIIAYIYIGISFMELYFTILFNFTKFYYLDAESILFSGFIYRSSYISFTGSILWIFYNIAVICFLVLGIYIFMTAKTNKMESKSLAKFMVVLGMVVLIGAFVKMNFLVLLGKNKLSTLFGSMAFQSALYDFEITQITPAIFWIFFISSNCAFMISALIITALGIKWTLLIENPENKKE